MRRNGWQDTDIERWRVAMQAEGFSPGESRLRMERGGASATISWDHYRSVLVVVNHRSLPVYTRIGGRKWPETLAWECARQAAKLEAE